MDGMGTGNQFALGNLAGRWSYPLPTWLPPLHPELSAMQVDSVEGEFLPMFEATVFDGG